MGAHEKEKYEFTDENRGALENTVKRLVQKSLKGDFPLSVNLPGRNFFCIWCLARVAVFGKL